MAEKSEFSSKSAQSVNRTNARYPAPKPTGEQGGCFERSQRNKPQSNSVGTASLIFVTGGMSMAWGLGFSGYSITDNMRVSWFIGAIIGAIIGAVIVNWLPKKLILLPATIFVILGGILFTAASKNSDAIMAARYINGIANGVTFVTCLVMAGEESVKSSRGMLTSTIEAMSFNVGLYTQVIFTASFSNVNQTSFSAAELHGILCIFYGAIAFVCGLFLLVESPVYFLVRNQEEKAIDSLRCLQRPFVVTTETYEQLLEHKAYVAESKEITLRQSAIAGLPALLKLCFYRVMVALSFSMFTSTALILAVYNNIASIIIYGTARYIGTLISALIMDCAGRKRPMLFGALICGGMALGVACVFDTAKDHQFSAIIYLLCVYQFFAGLYVTASSTYLTEAFPLAVKNYYIAVAFTVEMLVQIIVTCCASGINSISIYFYILSVLSFVFVVFGILCLPETKKTTLREAQALLKR